MIPGDPVAVEAAATALERATGFTEAATTLSAAGRDATAGWDGPAATAAREALERESRAVAAGQQACRGVAPALRAYAAELRAAQDQFARGRAAEQQGREAFAAARAPKPEGVATDPALQSTALRLLDDGAAAIQAAQDRMRLAEERAAAAIDEARAGLAAMAAVVPLGGTTPTAWLPPGASPPVPAPPPPGTPSAGAEAGHLALDAVGLVPVVGEAADVANAVWHGFEGEWVAAGLSLAAAVPLAGWLFTGGKVGVTGAKLVRDVPGAKAWMTGRPSMVPAGALREEFRPGRYIEVGEKYRWTDPKTADDVWYHAHGRDPRIGTEHNAGRGPVYRIKVGQSYLDAEGNAYTRNQLNPRSPFFDEAAPDATHIPYPSGQPAPGTATGRIAVPNAVSLLDDETD